MTSIWYKTLVACVLFWLVPDATVAQTDLMLRLPPAPSTIHGSISGSQANSLADHPIAELFDHVSEFSPLGLELFGYVQQGVTLNPDSLNDHSNGPVLTNYRSNAYQMNGLYLVAERRVNSDHCHVQLGGRIDTLYGADAVFGLSNGIDASIASDEASRFCKLAFLQIYANLSYPSVRGSVLRLGASTRRWTMSGCTTPRTFFTRIS